MLRARLKSIYGQSEMILKANKAAGLDGICSVVLKELADEVSPLLTNIFTVSIETGSIPQDWKEAYVTSCQLSS